MLPKKNRLNLSNNKRDGKLKGKRVTSAELSLTFNNTGNLKAAVIVSKKVAPLAVDRNRIKRVVTNVLKNQETLLGDTLIIVKTNIANLKQAEVEDKINKLILNLKND